MVPLRLWAVVSQLKPDVPSSMARRMTARVKTRTTIDFGGKEKGY